MITVDSTTRTQRTPPEVGGAIVLTALNLAFFAGLVTVSLAVGLTSGFLQWLSPYLLTAIATTSATQPVVGLLLALLIGGVVCAFLIAVFWFAGRVVAMAVYRKTVAALLRWHQR